MGKVIETQWQRWNRIAKAADVDWRSVRSYEENIRECLRPSTFRRIEKAVLEIDKKAKKAGAKARPVT